MRTTLRKPAAPSDLAERERLTLAASRRTPRPESLGRIARRVTADDLATPDSAIHARLLRHRDDQRCPERRGASGPQVDAGSQPTKRGAAKEVRIRRAGVPAPVATGRVTGREAGLPETHRYASGRAS